MRLTKR